MLDAVLADSEITRFLAMAPNTKFELKGYKPTTRTANGDPTIAGPAIIKLPHGVFESMALLKNVVGHELIHATHFESGSYARWYDLGIASDGLPYARHISEAYAYQ